MLHRTLVLSLLLVMAPASAQSIYKCVDKAGVISYSDRGCGIYQQQVDRNPQGGYIISESPTGSTAAENYQRYLDMQQAERQRAHDEAVAAEQRSQVAPVYQQRPHSDDEIAEQTRRCNIERSSLAKRSNAECLKLRAMLNLPEPPHVVYQQSRAPAFEHYEPIGLGRTVEEGETYMNSGHTCRVLGGFEHCD